MFNNIIETIGNTPMVKINKLLTHDKVKIYAKLEGFNPTGSIKDRIALKMLEQAEANGELDNTKTIIEATSGNTGIGLAMLGAVKGYKVEIIMSEAVSIERQKMIKSFGANIILTPAKLGTDGAIMKTKELIKKHPNQYFNPNQYSNQYNKLAHYETTAEEIWKQTNGEITHLVSAIGTSGTIMGIAKYLKEKNSNIKIVEAHPEKNHYIQGLKNMEEAIVPEIYDVNIVDKSILVKSDVAFEVTKELALKEGLLVGMSSGAAMYAASELAKELEEATIVVIFPDRGEKYLSTELFEG